MNNKLKRTLDDYMDRSFIYSVLLNKTHVHYGRLKTLFRIPIILTSSVMSVVNSNLGNVDDNSLKIVNITFNLLTALILSLSSALKFEEKYQNFLTAEKKFLKLSSVIEQKLINEDDKITSDFVSSVIVQYENIVDGIDYDIPSYIAKRVRDQYATKKTLPLIINGIDKKESCRRYSNVAIMKPLNSSILFDDVAMPKVLEVKPVI